VILTENFLTLGKRARGKDGQDVFFTKPVERIIIHWIGPYPHQSVFSPWYWWEDGSDGKGVQASAHLIVKGNECLQALPFDAVGWHSGDSRNYDSIGIETIPMNTMGEFDDYTIQTLCESVRMIRDFYPTVKINERHYDGIQKKNCPNFYTPFVEGGEQRWQKLKDILDAA
jgi:hypothetical protein